MNSKVYKCCAVPRCVNTSIKTPNKVFVSVPRNKKMRFKWLKLARRDPTAICLNSPIHFCEDHFDLPNDMDNFMQYHVMGSVSQVRMKPGCIPTKFECQTDRRKQTCNTTKRAYAIKKQRQTLIEECKKDLKEKTTKHLELGKTSGSFDSDISYTSVMHRKSSPSNISHRIKSISNCSELIEDDKKRQTAVARSPHSKVTTYPNKDATFPNEATTYPKVDATCPNKDTTYPNVDATSPNVDATSPNVDITCLIKDAMSANEDGTYLIQDATCANEDITYLNRNATSPNEDTTYSNTVMVLCPNCNMEAEDTLVGIQEQTKAVIANVYHYLKLECEEMQKMYKYLDLTPLSRFTKRAAGATGVSETTVLQILQEEEERNAADKGEPPRKRRRVRKRPKGTDSSHEEGSSDNDNDDEHPGNTDEAHFDTNLDTVVKIEPHDEEENHKVLNDPLVVKEEPRDDEENKVLNDPLVVKEEPRDDEENKSSLLGEKT